MKVTCTQENLKQGISRVARISEKSTNLPILNNILLSAKKEGLTLVSTNLEIAVKTRVRAKIETEGEFTVNGRLIAEFVSSLGKENITIEMVDATLVLKGENHETHMRGLDAVDFPVIPEVETNYRVTLPVSSLRQALDQVLFAVSTDEGRPELNGVFMKITETTITLAATDSYRLAEKIIQYEKGPQEQREVIVPAKTFAELQRIIDTSEDETMTISVNETQILFVVGETAIISRIVAGNYPDYQQIIPTAFASDAKFAAAGMMQAIKATSLFCKQGINDVRLVAVEKAPKITISAENSMAGKNTSTVTAEKTAALDIVFNYKFVLEGLQHCGADTVHLMTNEATSPALLKSSDDETYKYIIMPIKQ